MKKDEKYIMALDEGTSSAKTCIFNHLGQMIGKGQIDLNQYYPKPGWVEQDPEEILNAQKKSINIALDNAGIAYPQIASIGITNQRETTVLWDKKTGKSIYNAIVWQDRRTSSTIDDLNEDNKNMIKEKTGLIPDAYFSASKIKWLLDNISNLRKKAENNEVLFGTIDSFLIYQLTGGVIHATDCSNASRTMLYNINNLEWDDELLELFKIPKNILPTVMESSELYGQTSKHFFKREIPISGCAGDQQAALFGQACYQPGMVKNTYGTGNFILMNTGKKPYQSKNLLTTIAWSINGETTYALEGSVFITGAAVKWMESMQIINDIDNIGSLALSIECNEGVYFVPAFVGLGAPYWDPYARGTIIGITQKSGKEVFARAALESIGYLSQDVLDEMKKDFKTEINEIRVDGGGSQNRFLMQFQADISGNKVTIPTISDTTALGVAFLAGLSVGFWEDQRQLESIWSSDKSFHPSITNKKRKINYEGWKKAVARSKGWVKELKDVGFVEDEL